MSSIASRIGLLTLLGLLVPFSVSAQPTTCGSCAGLLPGGSTHWFKIVSSEKGPLAPGRFETYTIQNGTCCLAHRAMWPPKAVIRGVDLANQTVYASYPDGFYQKTFTHALIRYTLKGGGMSNLLTRVHRIWPCPSRFRWAALGMASKQKKPNELVVLDVSNNGQTRELKVPSTKKNRGNLDVASVRWNETCEMLTYRAGRSKKVERFKVAPVKKPVEPVKTERVVLMAVVVKGAGIDVNDSALFPAELTFKVESVLPVGTEFGRGLSQLSFKLGKVFYKNIGLPKLRDGDPVQVVLEGISGTVAASYQLRTITHR